MHVLNKLCVFILGKGEISRLYGNCCCHAETNRCLMLKCDVHTQMYKTLLPDRHFSSETDDLNFNFRINWYHSECIVPLLMANLGLNPKYKPIGRLLTQAEKNRQHLTPFFAPMVTITVSKRLNMACVVLG